MSMPRNRGRVVRRTVTPEIRESVQNAISIVQRKAAGVHGKSTDSVKPADKLLAQTSEDGFPQGRGWMHVLLDRYEANDTKFFMALARACRRKPFAPRVGDLETFLLVGWIGGEVKQFMPAERHADIDALASFICSDRLPPLCFWTLEAIASLRLQLAQRGSSNPTETPDHIRKTVERLGLVRGEALVREVKVLSSRIEATCFKTAK